jgi:hypothetical protein
MFRFIKIGSVFSIAQIKIRDRVIGMNTKTLNKINPHYGTPETMVNPLHHFKHRFWINDSWRNKKANMDKNFLSWVFLVGELF